MDSLNTPTSLSDHVESAAVSNAIHQSVYKKLLFLAVLVVGVIFSIGIALQAFWSNPFRGESPGVVLRLRLPTKNGDRRIDRSGIDSTQPFVKFRTSSEREILPANQYGTPDFRIVFMGGSTTECLAVEEGTRFHALVSDNLKKQGLSVNTSNIAKSGNTVHDSLNILLNKVVLEKPDVVVMMHATNDMGILEHDGNYRSRAGSELSLRQLVMWSGEIGSTHISSIGLLRHIGIQANRPQPKSGGTASENDLVRISYEEYKNRLKAFTAICKSFDIVPVLVTQPLANVSNSLTPDWADPRTQNFANDIIRSTGNATETAVIDLASYIETRKDWDVPMNYFYDGMHVTDRGSVEYATYISSRMNEILKNITTAKLVL